MLFPDHFTCSGRIFENWLRIVINLRAGAVPYISTLGSITADNRSSVARSINKKCFPHTVCFSVIQIWLFERLGSEHR
jgi:hypothetical protein